MFLYNISPTQWARIGNIQPTINAFFVKRVIARQFFFTLFYEFPQWFQTNRTTVVTFFLTSSSFKTQFFAQGTTNVCLKKTINASLTFIGSAHFVVVVITNCMHKDVYVRVYTRTKSRTCSRVSKHRGLCPLLNAFDLSIPFR